MAKLARPFFRAGGQSSWQDLVIARMPACKRYVELYAGPSALFWRREKAEGVQEVLIDQDRDAIKLCKWLRDTTNKQRSDMRAKVWSWDPTTFDRVAASNPKNKTDAAYKIKYLDLFATAEGKLDSSDAARKRTAKSFLDSLEDFAARLKDVELIVGDSLAKLAEYDDADTLVFADVPSEVETDALVEALGKLTKAKAIIGASGSVSVPEWKRLEISSQHGSARSTVLVNFAQPVDKRVIDARDVFYYTSGAHSHSIDLELREAAGWSSHAHLFAIDGMLVETCWDGEHRHYLDPNNEWALENTTAHQHEVEIGDDELETELDGHHQHAVLHADLTAYDGAHRHVLIHNGKSYVSLGAVEFWAMFVDSEVIEYTSYSARADKYDVAVMERAGKTLLALSAGDFAEAYELDGDPRSGCKVSKCTDLSGATLVSKGSAELGITHDNDRLVEFFVTAGEFGGQLILEHSPGESTAKLHTKVCPLALTPAGLDLSLAPGRHHIPSAVAEQLHKSARYWEAPDRATAQAMRNALVRKGVGHIAVVDGQFSRVNYELVATPAHVHGDLGEPINSDALASKATGLQMGEGLARQQPGETAKGVALHTFRVRGDATIYMSKQAPADSPHIELIETDHLAQAKLYACKRDGEERFVLGIVLEPLDASTPDLQNDYYTAETVRTAAHNYMAKHAHVGWHHEAIVDHKVSIVESYIAPVQFDIVAVDGTKVTVKAGTWLMGFRVHDDKLWEQTKTGIGGLSIGGWSKHRIAE
jgi:hypothetical protein